MQALKDIVPIDCFGSKCAVQVAQSMPVMTSYHFKEKEDNNEIKNNNEELSKNLK